MRAETERMLDQTLREETARQFRDAADAIKRGKWNMAHIYLFNGLAYLSDLDPNGGFYSSVVSARESDGRDTETDWNEYMEGSDDDA